MDCCSALAGELQRTEAGPWPPPSTPVLHRFGPAFHTVLNTDASNLAIAANLTQPDDKGRQNPILYKCHKPQAELTTAEQNYPAHVL